MTRAGDRPPADQRITTSALGYGLGYDERLLSALARGGRGNELFAEEADTAVALISVEVDGLLTQVAQAAALRLYLTAAVSGVTLLNDLPAVALDDGLLIELGSFYSGETRRLVLRLAVPGIAALGLARVATLELTHESLPDLVQHTAGMPVHVNVVPGDRAAGRIPDPQVRSEALFQQAQKVKRDSSRLLSRGRVAEASALLRQASGELGAMAPTMPEELSRELSAESGVLASLAQESEVDSGRAAKASSYDATRKSRNRGRNVTGSALRLVLHRGGLPRGLHRRTGLVIPEPAIPELVIPEPAVRVPGRRRHGPVVRGAA